MAKDYAAMRGDLLTSAAEGVKGKHMTGFDGLLIGALVLIADELHEANEQNRGAGVFRDCLLTALQKIYGAIERKL